MEEKFTTKDIYLAANLIAWGAQYDGADKTDPRHMEFYLTGDGIDFEELHTQWVNGTMMVNAVKSKNALQQLKSVVHSA